jgi:DNA excision repair protein ERCC-2
MKDLSKQDTPHSPQVISLSIRDFAIPVPRMGSIEMHSGYHRAAAEGQEIHSAVQERRSRVETRYQAEVKISHEFEREGYRFQVGGRMDGFFDFDPPKIEEIKTTVNLIDLKRKLLEPGLSHPYHLQLKTYGYFYWLQNQVIPDLTFHLVSTRTRESEDIEVKLDLTMYETWLDLRLNELVEEVKKAEKRTQRRRKIAEAFPFPFQNPRSGQKELIQSIEDGMKSGTKMFFQAPTGLGKTVGVLFPTLKEALNRGQNVVYVTPKNSQHTVAEDAVERFQESGSKIKSLTITAKSKICFKNEPLCNPDYCEYARDYYTKVYEQDLLTKVAKKKKLNAKVFRSIGEEHEVCPFQLQLDSAHDADTIICDYNYVFAPSSPLENLGAPSYHSIGKPNLVIDEAHNLPSRTMDYYSPTLSSFVLEKMREELKTLPNRFKEEVELLLNDCIQVIITCRPDSTSKSAKIEPPTELFLEQDQRLRAFLSRYLESVLELQPRDVVLRLCFYWSEFSSALEYVTDPKRKEFFTTFYPHSSGGIVKITCCDASDLILQCYDQFDQVVGFSATLKPFEYYAKLSGLDPQQIKMAEFHSPFSKSNRKVLIIPQISTKFSDREKNYPRIAEVIRRVASVKRGNYFVFFPSFDFLERVWNLFQSPGEFTVLKQEREMKSADVEAILEQLKQPGMANLVFAVQGGVLSEGVDFPGEMMIGAFIVGPPLPVFDLEREEMRKYYEKHYGSGFEYAYTYPAMAKSIQAAGRVIRSETDRGLIVLMDNRFIQSSYSQSMPAGWFENNPLELVSQSILKEVTDFWTNPEKIEETNKTN